MITSAKSFQEEDDDDDDEEEFVIKKEPSSHPKGTLLQPCVSINSLVLILFLYLGTQIISILTGNLSVKVDGKSTDQKPSTPRSKHSATEQRRRSKINDRHVYLPLVEVKSLTDHINL